jgi:hypothetical protein
MVHFEPPELLNLDFDADPNRNPYFDLDANPVAFSDFEADPDPKMMRIRNNAFYAI